MTDTELLNEIEVQKALMITVATGGPRIDSVNGEYTERRRRIGDELVRRRIEDPNPHTDLWRWHSKWSSGDLPSYASRRMYVADLYDPLLERVRRGAVPVGSDLFDAPTGWARVDRQIDGVRAALETARTEEDYQGVGHRCREVIISLAQAAYQPGVHRAPDGVVPSATDAKRMLEAYLSTEHAGDGNAEARRLVKAAFDLANAVQHRRTATFRDAALCAEATITAVNTVAILAGRRDETPREETAVGAAQRRGREEEHRQQSAAWQRSPEALSAMVDEFETLKRQWILRLGQMNGALSFRWRAVRDEMLVESPRAGLAAGLHLRSRSADDGWLAISEYDGFITAGGFFPDDQKAKRLAAWRYAIDRDAGGAVGWRDMGDKKRFHSSELLAEYHLKRLVARYDDTAAQASRERSGPTTG